MPIKYVILRSRLSIVIINYNLDSRITNSELRRRLVLKSTPAGRFKRSADASITILAFLVERALPLL